jgi:hypothetical protein
VAMPGDFISLSRTINSAGMACWLPTPSYPRTTIRQSFNFFTVFDRFLCSGCNQSVYHLTCSPPGHLQR